MCEPFDWAAHPEVAEIAAREYYQVPQRCVLGFDPGDDLRITYTRWLPGSRPLADCEDTPIFETMLIEGWHPDVDFTTRFLMAMRPTMTLLAEVCAAFIDGCSPELLRLAGIEPTE